MTTNILRIDASARFEGSVTRELNDTIIDRFAANGPVSVAERDLAKTPLPQIDEAWVGANFTPADNRTGDQAAKLSLSDSLVEEVKAADLLVIGLPIYNFSVPAALKAWIDQIARAGVTFAYTSEGPKGLLEGKRAIVTVSSGGVPVGSDYDFATGYLRHVLGFVGITDVVLVAADGQNMDAEAANRKAQDSIDQLPLAA